MARIYDPAQLSHSRRREFAVVAAWIATVAESASDLEDLLVAVLPAERHHWHLWHNTCSRYVS